MAEAQKGGEQSMDDILASIRKIISDEPTPNQDSANEADSGTERGDLRSAGDGVSGGSAPSSRGDDLSDILEPSGGRPDSHGHAHGDSSWPFNGGGEGSAAGEAEKPASSLKSKLASLDIAENSASRLNTGDGQLVNAQSASELELPGRTVNVETGAPAPASERSTVPEPGVQVSDPVIASTAPDLGVAKEVPLNEAVGGGASVSAAESKAPSAVQEVPSMKVQSDPQPVGKVVEPEPQADAEGAIAGEIGGNGTSNVPVGGSTEGMAIDSEANSKANGHAQAGEPTLETVVSAALQPMLKEWLDANLPRLVDERLKAEIERAVRDGQLKGQ